ncbi:MAG: hypothetical protein JNJ77_19940 [Planctomycetia bacterium]|nr:hypothetical protein [Planctomycetia bacterium]
MIDQTTASFAEMLRSRGHEHAAIAVVTDAIAISMGDLMANFGKALTKLNLDPGSMLKIGAVTVTHMARLQVLVGELKSEGNKLKKSLEGKL